jgi:hypothetical protein
MPPRSYGPKVAPTQLITYTAPISTLTGYIGDGSSVYFDIVHNMNTRSVAVDVYKTAGDRAIVICDVMQLSINVTRLRFNRAPGLQEFQYVLRAGLSYLYGEAKQPAVELPYLDPREEGKGSVIYLEPTRSKL